MNFIVFCLVSLITFIVTQFSVSQIIGILFYMLPQKKYNTIIGLIIWTALLIALYYGITAWFDNYFNVYLWVSIIASVISLFNIRNLKNEANQSQKNLSWDEYLEKNFPSQGTKTNFSDIKFKDNDQSEK